MHKLSYANDSLEQKAHINFRSVELAVLGLVWLYGFICRSGDEKSAAPVRSVVRSNLFIKFHAIPIFEYSFQALAPSLFLSTSLTQYHFIRFKLIVLYTIPCARIPIHIGPIIITWTAFVAVLFMSPLFFRWLFMGIHVDVIICVGECVALINLNEDQMIGSTRASHTQFECFWQNHFQSADFHSSHFWDHVFIYLRMPRSKGSRQHSNYLEHFVLSHSCDYQTRQFNHSESKVFALQVPFR